MILKLLWSWQTHVFKQSLAACVGDVVPWEDEVDPERITAQSPRLNRADRAGRFSDHRKGLWSLEEIGPSDPLVSPRAQLSMGTCSDKGADTRVTRGVT